MRVSAFFFIALGCFLSAQTASHAATQPSPESSVWIINRAKEPLVFLIGEKEASLEPDERRQYACQNGIVSVVIRTGSEKKFAEELRCNQNYILRYVQHIAKYAAEPDDDNRMLDPKRPTGPRNVNDPKAQQLLRDFLN